MNNFQGTIISKDILLALSGHLNGFLSQSLTHRGFYE
tara:strand:+ start:428 stop:538 length:111 start_codon:yes stop_codon:yes gene_type:complete